MKLKGSLYGEVGESRADTLELIECVGARVGGPSCLCCGSTLGDFKEVTPIVADFWGSGEGLMNRWAQQKLYRRDAEIREPIEI